MPTLSVAYCGGCNTAYDRVEFVNNLVAEIKKQGIEIKQVGGDEPADMRLIVTGCQAMCIYDRLGEVPHKIGHVIGPDNMDFGQMPQSEIVAKLAAEFRQLS